MTQRSPKQSTNTPPGAAPPAAPTLGPQGRAVGLDVHPDTFAAAGLNPSVVQSGEFAGDGALHQHGRGSLRALLIQASKRLLTTKNPLQKWGLSVALRRGTNKAAVAVARKLTVAVWHVLQGHWNKTLEENTTLLTKLAKLATELGVPTLRELGYASKIAFQEQKLEVLRTCP